MNRKQFLEYANHFNHKRWDSVVSYFCPDVTIEYPDAFGGAVTGGSTGRTVHGPAEFIANYQAITANAREVLNVGLFLSRGRHFCVELVTEFHYFNDPPTGSTERWKKGDVVVMNQDVLYDLDENGKFKRIRIFHHRYLDPSSVKLS